MEEKRQDEQINETAAPEKPEVGGEKADETASVKENPSPEAQAADEAEAQTPDEGEKDLPVGDVSDPKDDGKVHKKAGHLFQTLTAVLVAALVIVSVGLGTANQKLSRAKMDADGTILQNQEDYTALQQDNQDLQSQVDMLNEQVSQLQDQNSSLASKNDELENGASAQLVEIRNAYEAGKWQETIDKYQKLHEQYNGSPEDEEASSLASDAQDQLDAEEQEKAEEEAKGYDTGITYDQLARTPDDYMGDKVKFSGKVLQVIEGSGSTVQLRVAVDDDYDTVLYCEYQEDIVSSRVLEDDEITIYGYSLGTISYKSTLGGTITIPAVEVMQIDQ